MVADAQVLHILAADVKDKGDLGTELLRRTQMGKGLHLAAVCMECRLDNRLAVARRHCTRNIGICGHNSIELPQCIDDRLQGRAMIAAIGRVEQLLVPADGDELRRRRPRVDANIDCAVIICEFSAPHAVTIMACTEGGVVVRPIEQRDIRRVRLRCSSLLRTRNARFHLPHIGFLGIIRECRADRDEIIAVIHIDNVIRIELQCFDKAFFQFREKMQGTAEKGNIAVDGTPLREVSDGLVDDRLKDRQSNVRLCRTIVHECLDIRLGKHAAARGNRVDALALLRKGIETDGIG